MKFGRYPPDPEIRQRTELPLVMFYTFGKKDYHCATLVAHFIPSSLQSALLSVQRLQDIEDVLMCPMCEIMNKVKVNNEDINYRHFSLHCPKCDTHNTYDMPEGIRDMYLRHQNN